MPPTDPTARRCASPLCRNALPPEATGRRRYCSGTCRQAAWRITSPAATPPPARASRAELDALERAVRERAERLAHTAHQVATLPAGDDARTHALRLLPDQLDQLLHAQVAARRAAGASWEQIGHEHALHPDAARRRYSPDRRLAAETPPPATTPAAPAHDTPAPASASVETDHDTDVLLAALGELFGRNVPMRDAFLADQDAATREQYWGEVAEAKERIHRRSPTTLHRAPEPDELPTVEADPESLIEPAELGQADTAPAPVDQPPTAAKPRRAKRTTPAPTAAEGVPWSSDSDPAKRRRWYTDDELNAVQVVKTDRGDGAYWVIIAGDLLGTVAPHRTARGGRSGWEARHRSGSPAWHLGGGVKGSSKRPATRDAAVIDLIADVQHAWTTHRERRKRR